MIRRDFLGTLFGGAALVLVPQYGRWHRQGSGLLVAKPSLGLNDPDLQRILKEAYTDWARVCMDYMLDMQKLQLSMLKRHPVSGPGLYWELA